MKTHMVTVCLMAGVILCAAPIAWADTLEEVENKIAEAMKKHKSLITKSKYKQDMKLEGMEIKSESEVLSEQRNLGEEGFLSRVEAKARSVRKMQDQPEVKEESTMLMIRDRAHQYTYSETGEVKHAMKTRASKDDTNPFDVKAHFKIMRENWTMKLLPEESVDGKSCYVIEATPNAGGPTQEVLSRIVTWYDKRTGVSLKNVTYDKAGRETTTTVTTEVKIDSDIPDDRFVFKTPPGVTLIDMDALTQQPADTQEEPAVASDDPPAEQAAATEAPATADEEASEEQKEEGGIRGLFRRR